MENAFNTNTKVFHDAVQMLEAQLEVSRRVARDLYKVLIRLDAGPGHEVKAMCGLDIDFNAYLKEYIEELMASEAKQEEKAGPGPILLDSNGADGPTIFGG